MRECYLKKYGCNTGLEGSQLVFEEYSDYDHANAWKEKEYICKTCLSLISLNTLRPAEFQKIRILPSDTHSIMRKNYPQTHRVTDPFGLINSNECFDIELPSPSYRKNQSKQILSKNIDYNYFYLTDYKIPKNLITLYSSGMSISSIASFLYIDVDTINLILDNIVPYLTIDF